MDMFKQAIQALMVSGIVIVTSCRTMPQRVELNPPVESLSTYQQRALDYEKEGETELALVNWRIAENLVEKKIASLTEHMGNNVEKHYQLGLSYKKEGKKDLAAQEFITALRYDKDGKAPLKQIKTLNLPSRYISYTVKEGDSFESVAGQVYKNPAYEFIVRSFAGQDSKNDGRKLTAGQVIRLPILELEFTRRFFNFNREINLARKLYKDKDYQAILPIAENILVHVPDNEESVFLINSSYYGLAEKYFNEENYPAAVDMLKMIDPRFRNVKNRILYIERVQASRIREAKENAAETVYQKALAFEKRNRYDQALSVYESLDQGYKDVKDRISRLKWHMKKESDKHYMKGVQFFSNQKLEEAIGEWKEAITLDPANLKAKKDMENATQLLKKIKEIK
jgi:tetratricopeptide (TPR) repeat protein